MVFQPQSGQTRRETNLAAGASVWSACFAATLLAASVATGTSALVAGAGFAVTLAVLAAPGLSLVLISLSSDVLSGV
jgi:hypothetical protein